LLQHLSVKVFVKRNDFAGAIFCLSGSARPFSHRPQLGLIAQQLYGVARHCFHVAHVGHEAIHTVFDHFRHPTGAGRDRNHLTSHSFEGSQAKAFEFARHQQHVGDSELLADLILFTQKQDMFLNPFLHCQPLCLRTIGPVTDQQKLGWNFLEHAVKNFDYIEHAFHRAEVGEMHE